MANKKFLSSITVDDQLIPVTKWMLEHGRTSPADYLMFTPLEASKGKEVVLNFGDTEKVKTIFTGKVIREAPVCVAVDSGILFQSMQAISYIDTNAHAVVRGICQSSGIENLTINAPNVRLSHFQAESSAAVALRSLIATMRRLDVQGADDLVFYFDPAGTFYFGVFQDWKREVEVLQQRINLVDLRSNGAGYLAEVTPDMEIYHSQQVKMIHDLLPEGFYRVENVNSSFENGEHFKTLTLRPV